MTGADLLRPALVIGAYLLGGVCAGQVVARRAGLGDLRRLGSGNVGARNAGRLLGPRAFWTVFALDAAKGALAVGLARLAGLPMGWQAAVALAVVLGHILPVWLGFRGGKGAACAIGALLAFCPPVAVVGVSLYALLRVARIGRQTSGLLAMALAPLGALVVEPARLPACGLVIIEVMAAHLTRRGLRDG